MMTYRPNFPLDNDTMPRIMIMVFSIVSYRHLGGLSKDMSFKGKLRQGRYAVLTAAILACLSTSAYAAGEDSTTGGGAKVTTSDVNVQTNYDKELLKEEPETKTIITREELDRKGARTLSDALAAEQDIQMGRDNMGRQTVAIRGTEARHTLILIDGRRLAGGLSKFYGATDEVNRLGMDNIDHVEIIRGSGTARYGADAIGGVINIVTKMPHRQGGSVTLERSWIGQGGSQYNHNFSYATGELGKGIWMDFTYGRSKTAPFLYDYDNTSMQYYGTRNPFGARVEFSLGKGESLTLSADRLAEDLRKDTSLGTMLKMNAQEDAWRNNFNIDWKKQTSRADFRVRTYTTKYSSDVDFEVGPIVPGSVPYHHFYFDYLKREDRVIEASMGLMVHDKHYVTVGADYHDESGEGTRITVPGQIPREQSRLYVFPNPNDPNDPNKRTYTGNVYETSLNYYSAYVMDDWQVGKKLLVIPSLRYTNHSRFGAHLSPSIGATYKARNNLRVKANLGTSFSTPGIAELYHDWEMYEPSLNPTPPIRNGWLFEGNPNLRPEKAVNMDVSVEAELSKKTSAKFTIFRNDFKDYMQIVYAGEKDSKNLNGRTYYDPQALYPNTWLGTMSYDEIVDAIKTAPDWQYIEDNIFDDDQTDYVKSVPATDDVYTYKNISKARTQGIEAEVSHALSRDFSIKAGYTYLDARDRQTNKRLEGRGRHMLNLTMSYNDRKHGWRATFWGDYTRNYLDLRDRIFTGRIIGGTGEIEQFTFTDPNTGKVYHLFRNEEDAKKYMKGDFQHDFTREKIAREKNYGLWSLMVEKDIMRGGTLYAGVTNLFNQYDPYLGMGGRIYRFGMRMSF